MADSQSIRTIPGFSAYRVRSDGEVLSTNRGPERVLRGGIDKDGYRKFVLIDDAGRRCYVRRASLVCEAFHGQRLPGMTVRHLDGSRTNDAASNLAWGTQKENIADKLAHGTAQRGDKNPRARLTEAQVRQIRGCTDRPFPYTAFANAFGVSKGAISTVVSGRTWRWL